MQVSATTVPAKVSADIKDSVSSKIGDTISDEFERNISPVHSAGSESEPTWLFDALPGEHYLNGLLSDARLGTVRAEAKPVHARAAFDATPHDLWIGDGNWNALGELKQRVARLFLAKKLDVDSSLSTQDLSYE